MAILDGHGGYHIRCDRCGTEFRFKQTEVGESDEEWEEWARLPKLWVEIFKPRMAPKLIWNKHFCLECQHKINPMVLVLKDISDLESQANKLGRAINEKRNQKAN
jgi:hypothetical protein